MLTVNNLLRNLNDPRPGRNAPTSKEKIEALFERYSGDSWYTSIFLKGRGELRQEIEIKRLEEIKRFYQGANKIKEIIDRFARALLGREFEWFLVDEQGEQVSNFFEQQLHSYLRQQQKLAASMQVGYGGKNPIEKAVADAKICGLGYLRLYDPQQEGINFTLHSPSPLDIEVGRDNNGYPQWIKYYYTQKEEDKIELYAEHQTINRETDLTEFRIIKAKQGFKKFSDRELGYDDDEVIDFWTLNLGKNYTVYEISLDSLISQDLERLQDGLNYMITLMLRNLGYAGLSRESVLNGLPPGEYVRNEDTGQLEYKQNGELETIPGSQSFISGIPIMDDAGSITGYTNPQIASHEPSSVQHFTESIKAYEQIMYTLSQQGHLLEGGGQLSAISRREQRHDFDASLRKDAVIVSRAIASIYITSLYLLNQADALRISQLGSVDISASLNTSSGEPSPEELQQVIQLYQAGIISRKTAMMRTGYVEDPDNESKLIEEEMELLTGGIPSPLDFSEEEPSSDA